MKPSELYPAAERVEVLARDLRAGDYLLGSRQTVISASYRTGDKYVRMHLLTSRGTERAPTFNARTRINVERKVSV